MEKFEEFVREIEEKYREVEFSETKVRAILDEFVSRFRFRPRTARVNPKTGEICFVLD